MKYALPYRQAVELQRRLMDDARKDDARPLERAKIALSFCALEDLKRKLRNKPTVKPVDVSHFERKHKVETPVFTES